MATKGYIRYRADYKYQLANDYSISISIKPKSVTIHTFDT